MDVISFLSQLVSNGLDHAINERTKSFQDLAPGGRLNDRFELAVEARIPSNLQSLFNKANNPYDTVRYEVAIGIDKKTEQVGILEERVLLKIAREVEPKQINFFPMMKEIVPSLITKGTRNSLTVVNKVREGNDYFRTEFYKERRSSWQYAFRLGLQKSALGNLPADESQFPAATSFRNLLSEGTQSLV